MEDFTPEVILNVIVYKSDEDKAAVKTSFTNWMLDQSYIAQMSIIDGVIDAFNEYKKRITNKEKERDNEQIGS